jgi:hypothetical protein
LPFEPDSTTAITEAVGKLTVIAAVDADRGQAAEVARAALGYVRDPDLSWAGAAGIITWLYRIAVRAGRGR